MWVHGATSSTFHLHLTLQSGNWMYSSSPAFTELKYFWRIMQGAGKCSRPQMMTFGSQRLYLSFSSSNVGGKQLSVVQIKSNDSHSSRLYSDTFRITTYLISLKEELSLYSATQLEEAYIPSLRSYCIQVWPDCIFCSEFQKTNAKVLARPKILSEALLAEFCSLWWKIESLVYQSHLLLLVTW